MPIKSIVPNAHRYVALDALRGAAAFAVLFYHLRSLDASGRPAGGIPVFASGYLAVDMFFLLSGFVISHAYGARLQDTLTFRQFMTARFVRLQPVIAFATLIGFAFALGQRLMMANGAPGLFAIATSLPANMLMLPNVLVPWGIFLFNPPAWSLFYELAANAVYALGIRQSVARAHSTGDRVELTMVATCIIGLIGLATSIALVGDLDKGVVLKDAPVALARISFSFALGLLIHRRRHLWIPRLPRLPAPWLLLACLTLLAPDFSGAQQSLYDLVFIAILSPGLVMLTAVTQPSPLFGPMASWLGMISYPLYAVHAPIKHLLEAVLPVTFLPLLAACLCTTVLVAWTVGQLVDPVLRKWLSDHLASKKTDTPPALAASPSLPEGT